MKIINKWWKYNFQDENWKIVSKLWFDWAKSFYNWFALVKITNPINKIINFHLNKTKYVYINSKIISFINWVISFIFAILCIILFYLIPPLIVYSILSLLWLYNKDFPDFINYITYSTWWIFLFIFIISPLTFYIVSLNYLLYDDTYIINEKWSIIKKFKKVKFDKILDENYIYDYWKNKYKLVYKIDDFWKYRYINFDTLDIDEYEDKTRFIDIDDYNKIKNS